MALQSITIQVGQDPTRDMFSIAIPSLGLTHFIDKTELRNTLTDPDNHFTYLLFQMFQQIQASGLNPQTATLAQLKTALEAGNYKF